MIDRNLLKRVWELDEIQKAEAERERLEREFWTDQLTRFYNGEYYFWQEYQTHGNGD